MQPLIRWQGITIFHRPKCLLRIAQRVPDRCQAVDLFVGRLPELSVQLYKVVPINGSCSASHGTGWP